MLKLVEWTRRLPFYEEIPVELHTRLLTNKWHELLVLTTSAYQAIYGTQKLGTTHADGSTAKPHQEVSTNLVTLQTCLTSMMGRPITMDQLRQDVGTMVEKITKVITSFRNFQLSKQEYVCLKVVAMLTQEGMSDNKLISPRFGPSSHHPSHKVLTNMFFFLRESATPESGADPQPVHVLSEDFHRVQLSSAAKPRRGATSQAS